jgi:hypothetical protein
VTIPDAPVIRRVSQGPRACAAMSSADWTGTEGPTSSLLRTANASSANPQGCTTKTSGDHPSRTGTNVLTVSTKPDLGSARSPDQRRHRAHVGVRISALLVMGWWPQQAVRYEGNWRHQTIAGSCLARRLSPLAASSCCSDIGQKTNGHRSTCHRYPPPLTAALIVP